MLTHLWSECQMSQQVNHPPKLKNKTDKCLCRAIKTIYFAVEHTNSWCVDNCSEWKSPLIKNVDDCACVCVLTHSGASADGGAGGPEVQWTGAVPAARQRAGGHVPPAGGGLRRWEAGQARWGGHAEAAGQVSKTRPHTHVLHGMWIHTGSKSGDVSSLFEPMWTRLTDLKSYQGSY